MQERKGKPKYFTGIGGRRFEAQRDGTYRADDGTLMSTAVLMAWMSGASAPGYTPSKELADGSMSESRGDDSSHHSHSGHPSPVDHSHDHSPSSGGYDSGSPGSYDSGGSSGGGDSGSSF